MLGLTKHALSLVSWLSTHTHTHTQMMSEYIFTQLKKHIFIYKLFCWCVFSWVTVECLHCPPPPVNSSYPCAVPQRSGRDMRWLMAMTGLWWPVTRHMSCLRAGSNTTAYCCPQYGSWDTKSQSTHMITWSAPVPSSEVNCWTKAVRPTTSCNTAAVNVNLLLLQILPTSQYFMWTKYVILLCYVWSLLVMTKTMIKPVTSACDNHSIVRND